MGSPEEGWRWVLHGRVQGVGFRAFTRNAAVALGLTGWVRNRSDGTVEVEVEGSAPELDELRRRLRQGPTFSRVERLEEEPLEALRGFEGFTISFDETG